MLTAPSWAVDFVAAHESHIPLLVEVLVYASGGVIVVEPEEVPC